MPRQFRKGKASKDKKQDKRIRNLENAIVPEVKSCGFGQDATATTGTFTLQYAPLIPAQGVLSVDRVGFDYAVHGIDIKAIWYNPSATAFSGVQCWILQDMGMNGAQLTDVQMRYNVTTPFQNATAGWNDTRVFVPGFKNPLIKRSEQNRIKVLWDSGLRTADPVDHTVDQTYQGNNTSIVIQKKLRFKKPLLCKAMGTGSTIASGGPGTIQFVWASTSTVTTLTFGAITYFTDS